MWDDGAQETELSPDEMIQLASRIVIPSERHGLINWLTFVARTVWADAEELPETVSKWTTYLDPVQIIREMGMWQMMFHAQYNSPDEEVFTTHMKDLILTSGPAGTFGTMAALLAPYVDRRIHKAMSAMTRLGNVEVKCKERTTEVRAVLPPTPPNWPVRGQRHGQKGGNGRTPNLSFHEGELQTDVV